MYRHRGGHRIWSFLHKTVNICAQQTWKGGTLKLNWKNMFNIIKPRVNISKRATTNQ